MSGKKSSGGVDEVRFTNPLSAFEDESGETPTTPTTPKTPGVEDSVRERLHKGGWLEKRGETVILGENTLQYKRRFFRLEGHLVQYYDTDDVESSHPLAAILSHDTTPPAVLRYRL